MKQEMNDKIQEGEKLSLLDNLVVEIVGNHPFLAATSIGVLSAGVAGLSEYTIKAIINHFGGDVNQFPNITPGLLALGESALGYFNAWKPQGVDFNDDQRTNFECAIFTGLAIGSALSCAGLNYLLK